MYYLTVLITLLGTMGPPTGWVQWSEGFNNKAICEKSVALLEPQMRIQIATQFGEKLADIGEFECITRQEAVERNSKLGH